MASKIVKKWFSFSAKDLRTAKVLDEIGSDFWEQSVFFCQQSIEKSLKGFLVFHKVRIRKVHDLVQIFALARSYDQSLTGDISELERLTEYAVAYRYPDAASGEISHKDVKEAISAAEHFYAELSKKCGL